MLCYVSIQFNSIQRTLFTDGIHFTILYTYIYCYFAMDRLGGFWVVYIYMLLTLTVYTSRG